MSRIYVKSELENAWVLDLRRSGVQWNGTQKSLFTDMATTLIGERLRSNANEGFVTLSPEAAPDDNLYLLPADYVEARFVEQVNGDTIQKLRPLGVAGSTGLRTSASTALGYSIYSQAETGTQTLQMVLQLTPANGQDIMLDYWQEPTYLNASSDTNPVLSAHFQLYLWGTEIFAWQSVQNWDQRDRVQQLFDAELERINSASNMARYGAGAARGTAARFYNSAPSRVM